MKRTFYLLRSTLLCLALSLSAAIAQAQNIIPHDVLAPFDHPTSFVDLDIGGASTELDLINSAVSLSSDDVFCQGPGCTFTLNHLMVTFHDFTVTGTVNGDPAQVNAAEPYAIISGPVTITRQGTVFVIPAGTPARTSAILSGGTDDDSIPSGRRSHDAGLVSDLLLRVDPLLQIVTIDGTFDFSLPVLGVTIPGTARVMGANGSPFTNLPPVANAGPDQSLVCPQFVTLNGSASTDPENNIVQYFWASGANRAQSADPISRMFLGAGTHQVTLTVFDAYNSSSSDTVTVNITQPQPTFTFVPPTVTRTSCGVLNIGRATASSPCETVTVTSNAPSSFPAGVTIVTWTGTTPSGKTITATQRVVVVPNDSPACCPSGSNIILGTSNNDTLIGTAGRDCILGLNGQDVIDGRGGDDIISGGEGDDQLTGGDGADVINAGNGQDRIFGGAGADTLFAGGGDDRVEGGDGNDEISGGDGQDQLFGQDGNDRLFGDTGDDRLDGGNGDDLLNGGANNNQCTGGPGVDQLLLCTALDGSDQPSGGGNMENFNVCLCPPNPNKCNDCSSGVQTCTSTPGCRSILACVEATPGCRLPHECSASCEGGMSPAAISAARSLASCLGGCE